MLVLPVIKIRLECVMRPDFSFLWLNILKVIRVLTTVRAPYFLILLWLFLLWVLIVWTVNSSTSFTMRKVVLDEAVYVCNSTIGNRYTGIYVRSDKVEFYKSTIDSNKCGYVELDLRPPIEVEYMGNVLASVTSLDGVHYSTSFYDVFTANLMGGVVARIALGLLLLFWLFLIFNWYRVNGKDVWKSS